jgi:hypothetical protein
MGKKRVRISREDAVIRLDGMIEHIYRDVRVGIGVEAALETGNAIVMNELRDKPMDGTECYNTIHQSNTLFLALTLAKLFEMPRPRQKESKANRYNRSDVASIPLMIRLLKQKRCRDALIARAREWTPHIELLIDAQAAACEQAINNAVLEYAKLKKSYKGRTAINNLASFRNKMLAHNLLGEAMKKRPSYDELFLLMDVARDITGYAKLAILGENLDMIDYETERVRASKAFWSLALKLTEC